MGLVSGPAYDGIAAWDHNISEMHMHDLFSDAVQVTEMA